jgi:hypothetical protein
MDDDLVATGRYARLEFASIDPERPRASVTVGFVELPDGALAVAATAPDARWATSLAQARRARVTIADRSYEATASELAPADPARNAAIRDLILRYGTPSEGLGLGPVFRLDPVADH